MTDNRLPPLSTQIEPPSRPPLSLPASASAPGVQEQQPQTNEDEEYTITCICTFEEDDGATILCEKCGAWQHIDCYYPDNHDDLGEEFHHFCVDCVYRSLPRQAAIERQKAKRLTWPVVEESIGKKAKRPPAKSHKKKLKPADLSLNGLPNGADIPKHGSSNDQAPSRKSKTSKPTSAGAQAPKRSPSHGSAKAGQGHPPSPATSPPDLPDDLVHSYSDGFLSLYDDDAFRLVSANLYDDKAEEKVRDWRNDPAKLKTDTRKSPQDILRPFPANMNSVRPTLDVHVEHTQLGGMDLEWRCLRPATAVAKDVPLIELNGYIGVQRDYCENPDNRWEELAAPLPFVVFHPMLPLYIDTRKEGSLARYVRRSCRPNSFLDTYLYDDGDWHFWLVSDRNIEPGEAITIAWDCRFSSQNQSRWLRALGLDEETRGQSETTVDEAEYQNIGEWVHRVLSEYGGCACNLGNLCAFKRFHQNHINKLQTTRPKKRPRKTKAQQAISPTSTGHATNSRAASEGHTEDAPEADCRSGSGSSRSKPPSRDRTPTQRQGSFDTLGILTEPTDRDKRKVAMVEDSFRRMEQQQPPRKKKRTSDSTTASAGPSKSKTSSSRGSATTTPQLPNGGAEPQYVDAGTSRSESGSPVTTGPSTAPQGSREFSSRRASVATAPQAATSSPYPRRSYVDAAVQCEIEESPKRSTAPKRRVVSLSRRLFENRRRQVLEMERRASLSAEQQSASTMMEIDSPPVAKAEPSPPLDKSMERITISTPPDPAPDPASHDDDKMMPDAPMSSPAPGPPIMSPKIPDKPDRPEKPKSPQLRVQLPPVPAFNQPSSAISPMSTAMSTTGSGPGPHSAPPPSSLPSPFGPLSGIGAVVAPSPVKKKMSLSDYTRKINKGVARPVIGTTVLKSMTSPDDTKSSPLGAGGAATNVLGSEKTGNGSASAKNGV